jgi:hypothetical protein
MERRPAPTSHTLGIEFEEELLEDIALSPLHDVTGGGGAGGSGPAPVVTPFSRAERTRKQKP